MKNTIEHTYKTNKEIDYPLLFVSIAMVGIIAIVVGFFPDTTNHYASLVFDWVTSMLGSSIQVLVLLGFFFTLFIAFSKYGNIKLGNQEPEFKILPWIFMFMVAGIGSSTLYWAIVEWIYYYQDPGLGLKPLSKEALEHSVSFSYFHWGIGAWSTYALASIIMAYHFHVRKQKGLSLSSIVLAVFKFKSKSYQNIIGRIVDLVFLTASVGALVLSLVFTVLSLGAGFQVLTGLSNNFATQAIITIVSATIFCLSSYIGVDKGIQMLSSIVGYGVAIFVIIVLFIGPTEFILNNIANSLGITMSDYFRMSLSTEPYGDGVFTKSWTVFFWLWWFSYTPGVAMFATRISAGRKIREVILGFLNRILFRLLVLFWCVREL